MTTRKWQRISPDLEIDPSHSTRYRAGSQTSRQKQQVANPVGMGAGGCGLRDTQTCWHTRGPPCRADATSSLPSLPSAVEWRPPCPPALPHCCWSLPWCFHSSADREGFCHEVPAWEPHWLLPVWDLATTAAPRTEGFPVQASTGHLVPSVLS